MMALTATEVAAAAIPEGKKQVRLADAHGLYLQITKAGQR